MENNRKRLAYFGIVISLCGCRPFQPPPAEFESYVKPGITSKGVIEQMVKCGYPDAGGFVGGNGYKVSFETEIRAEQCMFRAGFKHKNGSRSLCSLTKENEYPECKE